MEESETVLLINKHIEDVLEDRPTRGDVLSILDKIKSLEKLKSSISYYITSKDEFDAWRSLWRFIHLSELEVSYKRVFYYELPTILYNWLASHSFNEIIGQIAYHIAYLNMVDNDSKYEILNRDIYPAVLEVIKQKQKTISKLKLIKSDVTDHRKLLIEYGIYPALFEDYVVYLKYNIAHFNEYKKYPIPPFRIPKGHKILDKDWEIIKERWDFYFTTYESNKNYFNINRNRLFFDPDGFGYSDNFLNIWKYFYEHNFDIYDSIFENVKAVSTKATKKEFYLLCDYCYSLLDFENAHPNLLQPENHEFICNQCYYENYFENS